MKTSKRALSLLLAVLAVLTLSPAALAASAPYAVNASLSGFFNDYEWEELRLTNEERMAEGLDPVTSLETMQQAARVRSQELIELFSHTRPDGTQGLRIVNEYGVSWQTAGENIAVGQNSPSEVNHAWMHSEGHKANILTDDFTHMGIGYVAGGDYGHNWTQLFVGACSATGISILYGSTDGVYPVGTEIDMMAEAVKVSCSHGVGYMPLSARMCSGYDPDTLGRQTVTVSVLGKTTSFTVTLGEADEAPAESKDVELDGLIFSLKSDKTYAVTGCTAPGDVLDIPASVNGVAVTELADGVFDGRAFNSVTLPESLTRIGDECFFGAYVDGVIYIPAGVKAIGTYAFSYISACEGFVVAPGNTAYRSEDGVLYNADMTTLINYPLAKPGDTFYVPDSVQLLYCTCFANSYYLTTLVVPGVYTRAMTYTFFGDTLTIYGVPGGKLHGQLGGLSGTLSFADINAAPLPPASYPFSALEAADALFELGLFRGTNNGYELERGSTRQEALVMLLRLLGEENAALGNYYEHPFTDVDSWAANYVGYAYAKGYTNGMGGARFGGGATPAGCQQYITFVLRSLGYSDADGDFSWRSPWTLSDALGLTLGQYDENTAEFTRADMVLISYAALDMKLKGTDATLRDVLAL